LDHKLQSRRRIKAGQLMNKLRHTVCTEERTLRNRHTGQVVWLTGLSASGKTTIANALERELFNQGRQVYVLDGDKMRQGLCSDLGFSPESRSENIRRVGEVAKLFSDAGLICITAFISPYRSDRDLVRAMLPAGGFIEVFINAPLAVCEQRDPKGFYAKARAGIIKDFTGISAPYEPPLQPEVELRTDQIDVAACVAAVVLELAKRGEAVKSPVRPAAI
jgi:adenylyl-sulfate kinase